MKVKILIVFFVIFAIILSLNLNNIIYAKEDNYNNINITSHRGNIDNCKENSLEAIERVIEEKVDYVEVDLRITKDKKVILCHDDNLKRLYKINKKVKDLTLEEINKISNNEITTLDDVFNSFNKKIKFNLELKVENNDKNLSKEVSKLIKKYDMNEYVLVTSFNKKILYEFKNKNKNIKIGYICSNKNEDLKNIDAEVLSLQYNLVNRDLVEILHNNNKEVHVWTVNDVEIINKIINDKVDNIITDNISVVKDIINKKIP